RRDPRNPRRLLPTNQRLTTLEQAYVLVRCIEIGTEDSDLARRITRFANTQNAVLSQDFVFLDKQQHRLVQELQTMGYTYLLRSGESPGNADSSKVIEVRQAAVALACATGDVGHAVTAKREVSKLFDRDSGPYEALFNPSVEGIFLIRVTKVVSDVDEALDDAYSESEGQRIGIAVHGRRVIAHLILNNIGQKNLKNPDFDFDQALRDVQSSALRILDSFTENFPENAYPGNVFKNRKRCEELISNVK
ncbi:AIPR family protein, partial [Nocardia seriolae]